MKFSKTYILCAAIGFLCFRSVESYSYSYEYRHVYWTGAEEDSTWGTAGNWKNVDGDNVSNAAPDQIAEHVGNPTVYNCLQFTVLFNNEGIAHPTVNILSGFGDRPEEYILEEDTNAIQIIGAIFQEGAPAYTINLSGANMESGFFWNDSEQAQTVNISAGRSLDLITTEDDESTYGMTFNNSGIFRTSETTRLRTSGTLTNHATGVNERGTTVLLGSSVSDWNIVNNGGATWRNLHASIEKTEIRNKISNNVPGYLAIQGGGQASVSFADTSLGIDIDGNTNGFVLLTNAASLIVQEEEAANAVLNLYLDPTATFSNTIRTLIYKNGTEDTSTLGEGAFTVNIKDTDGNPLTDVTYTLDYEPTGTEQIPEGVTVPNGIDDVTLQELLAPLLRITLTRAAQAPTITQAVRQHHGSAASSTHSVLGNTKTVVHQIFRTVTQTVNGFNGRPIAQYGNNDAISKSFVGSAFKAPSLDHSFMNMTQGMVGVMAQETMERFAPLRTDTTGIWAQPFGQISEQNRTSRETGYNTRTAGILFGMDHKINQNVVVGGGIGSATSTSELKVNGSKFKIEDRFATAFATYTQDDWYVEALMTGSLNDFKSGRKIDASTVATNTHRGYQLVPAVGAGYRFKLSDAWTGVPSIVTAFLYNHENGYQERGAGVNNHTIKSRSSSQTRTEAGMNFVTQRTHENMEAFYTLGARLVMNDPVKKGPINGTVGGNGFGINTNQKTTVRGAFSASTEVKFDSQWFMNVHYAGEFGSRYHAHEAALRIGKRL